MVVVVVVVVVVVCGISVTTFVRLVTNTKPALQVIVATWLVVFLSWEYPMEARTGRAGNTEGRSVQ